MGIEVAKARLAAKPIVAKPNVDCITIFLGQLLKYLENDTVGWNNREQRLKLNTLLFIELIILKLQIPSHSAN